MDRKHNLTPASGFLLLLVSAYLLVFLIYPLLYVFKSALWIEGRFSLQFFANIITDETQRILVINSFKLAISVTLATTLVSLPLAYILTRFRFPGRGVFQGLILIPMIMPPFVGAIGMKQLFGLYGSINTFLVQANLVDLADIAPASFLDWFGGGFFGVVLLSTLHLYPIMYLNVSASLANVDPSLEEAAENMGASKTKLFFTITLPLMIPGYFAGAIIVFIWSFTDLGTPLIFDYYDVIAVRIFKQVSDINVNPSGYALVVLIITLTAACFWVSKRMTASRQYAMVGRGHVGSRENEAVGLTRWFIYAFMCGLGLLAVLPHLSIIMISLTPDASFLEPLEDIFPKQITSSHYGDVFQHEDTFPSIKNSLFYSVFSTILAVVSGLLISFFLTRKELPFKNLLDSVAMLPLALPGVAIAFGYVGSFSSTTIFSFLDPRENPVALLIIGYSVRRLPYMLRSIYAGLQQTSVTYEEASANLGATSSQTLFKITFPLIAANIIAGSILVFSFSMLEVSESLILAMKDEFAPITKAIYNLSMYPGGEGTFLACALGVVGMLLLIFCLLVASRTLGGKLGEIFKI